MCAADTLRDFARELYDFERWPATDSEGSGDLESWQGALHQAAGHVLNALAALEGSTPAGSRRRTWRTSSRPRTVSRTRARSWSAGQTEGNSEVRRVRMAVEASDGIVGYLRELVDAKRQTPADDLGRGGRGRLLGSCRRIGACARVDSTG